MVCAVRLKKEDIQTDFLPISWYVNWFTIGIPECGRTSLRLNNKQYKKINLIFI